MAGEVKITVNAVPNIASAQAAAQQMAQAAQAAQPWVRIRAARGGIPPIANPPELIRAEQAARRANSERQKMIQGMSFLAAPVTNPTSLWGNLLSGVAIQRALATQRGQQMIGRFGLSGPGGTAIATAGIIGVAAAVGVALKSLTTSIKMTSEAIQRATRLFAFKGVSGLSDRFASQRMTAAGIIGVSTEEVMRFGAAMSLLNSRLKQANENFAKSFKTLTLVNFNWKILGTNLESLFTTIATKAAPGLNSLANGLSRLVNVLDKAAANSVLGKLMASAAMAPFGMAVVPFGLGSAGEAPVGPSGQVPKKASAWERMGLVVGGPMGADRTSQLLKAQLNMLEKIHRALAPNVPRGTSPLNPNFHLQQNLPKT